MLPPWHALRGRDAAEAGQHLARSLLGRWQAIPEVVRLIEHSGRQEPSRPDSRGQGQGEIGPAYAAKVTCGELLDDLLEYAKTNIKPSTEKSGGS